jgi:hypothetical protein
MPAEPRNLLMAELAVQTGFATREQVNECLGELENAAEGTDLADVLLSRNLISKDQSSLLNQLADSDTAPRKEVKDEEDFDRLVEIKQLAAAGEVEKVMEVLREMRGDSQFARLGQILLKKSLLNAEQMHALLEEKGIRVMRCPKCGKNLEVKNYNEKKAYGCGACKVRLQPIDLSEIPIPDADIDVVVEEG